ncbi:MAG: hypothetical protein U0T83_07915 [Bacteriovoracaceae bacterium]
MAELLDELDDFALLDLIATVFLPIHPISVKRNRIEKEYSSYLIYILA